MPDHQRIFVVSAPLGEAEVERLRRDVGRDPVTVVAPTAEAARVVRALDVAPRVEVALAPVSYPQVDRGHRLDELVRRHALVDRFRDVVVVTDRASAILLLRVLAPDQLAGGGAVALVGLPRSGRPVVLRRAVLAGLVLGVLAFLAPPPVGILVPPALAALAALALLVPRRTRHLGQEAMLAAGIGLLMALAMAAGSARFLLVP